MSGSNWRAAGLVAIVALVAGVSQTGPGRAVLRESGLSERPATYTSLAFLHPQSLPEQLGTKQARENVSFTITNTGSTAYNYQWSVRVVQGQGSRSVAAGSVLVASGGNVSITRSVKISCPHGQVQIVVSLVRPVESIDAWMACRPSRS